MFVSSNRKGSSSPAFQSCVSHVRHERRVAREERIDATAIEHVVMSAASGK
jgi:hypothetical protein